MRVSTLNFDSSDVVRLLRKMEWSMGNGQCIECGGMCLHGNWGRERKDRGHKLDCALAGSLRYFDEPVNWIELP